MGEAIRNSSKTTQRDISIDYLRAFVIVLVVLLHSALAYTSFSTFDRSNWIKSSAPIVDTTRFSFFNPIAMYLDTFFMPLLFLVSGFFIVSGLTRYGGGKYLIHRIKRLGVPFVFAVLLIAPLSFLPSFLAANPHSSTSYLLRYFTTDGWPTGPPWFLWVLLVFNGFIVVLYQVKPDLLQRLTKAPPKVRTIFLLTFIAFIPLRLITSHFWWFSLGPFDLQPIRMGVFFVYLVIGIALGNSGGLGKATWIRFWPIWLLIGFIVSIPYSIFLGGSVHIPNFISTMIISITFAISCTASSLGFLGAFKSMGKRRYVFFDSLSANSFGIFILHYAYTIWIQYSLLFIGWTALVKFILTFMGSLLLSWGTSIILRKIPMVRGYL